MYNAIVTPYYTEDGVLEIKLDSEPGNLDIYYTFDNTDPDNFTECDLVTYCHLSGQQADWQKVITLTIKELEKRADNTRHVVGNL